MHMYIHSYYRYVYMYIRTHIHKQVYVRMLEHQKLMLRLPKMSAIEVCVCVCVCVFLCTYRRSCHAMSSGIAHFSLKYNKTNFCLPARMHLWLGLESSWMMMIRACAYKLLIVRRAPCHIHAYIHIYT
jgi:hypothetical protein